MEDYLATYSKSNNNLAQISIAINDWQHLSVSHPSPYEPIPLAQHWQPCLSA